MEAYKKRTTVIGSTFWERQKRGVEFQDWGVEVVEGLILMHLQIQNGAGQGYWGGNPPLPPGGGPNFPVFFPKTSGTDPVPGRGVPG